MESKAVQYIPIEKLMCRPQVREQLDEESLIGLAQTIKETGILQSLLARRDSSEFVVLEGHRRLLAAKMAGLTHVPVMIDDRELSEGEVIYRQLILNCSREDLQPLEKARAIKRLMTLTNWPAAQVAVKLGVSPGMVAKLLALLSLPESVQEKVAAGSLPLTTAYELSKAPDAGLQRELAMEAANGGLTRDEVVSRAKSHRVAHPTGGKTRKPKVARERINIPLGSGRSVAVAGPSLTLSSMIEWLADLVERLRALQGRNVEISEAVKLVVSQG